MRVAVKIFAFFAVASTLFRTVSASSPFDAVLGYLPDLAVTDIHQEGRFVYARVCNFGGTLADSEDTVVLATRVSGGSVISLVAPIVLEADNCHEFRVASVDELGITTSGMYDITAGAVLKDGRLEKVKTNNKLNKSVNIIYPSTNAPALQNPIYYNNSYNNNYNGNYPNNYYNSDGRYCDASNNYCSNTSYYGGSNTYYCNPVNQNCYRDTYRGGSNTYYCPTGNNLCLNNTYNGSYNYSRSNICPPGDYACNNDYYNSTNTRYQNDNRNCTYSNNYCRNSDYKGNRQDGSFQYQRPDLVVDSLLSSDSNRTITARVCNRGGGDMYNTSNWTVEIANTTTNSFVRNSSSRLSGGQCAEVSASYSSLGIYRSGGYNFRVTVDPNNSIDEQSEWNNTTSQYLQLWTNY